MERPLLACPACGAPMEERVARRGQHAGQPFWGCSRYPRCRGTRPKAGPPSAATTWAPPQLAGGAQALFQMGGGRLGLDLLAELDSPSLSNWCLVDYTEATEHQPPDWSPAERQVLAVARKLLTRGRRPLLSPEVEAEILAQAALPADLNAHKADLQRALYPPAVAGRPRSWRYQRPEEELFLREAAGAVLGAEALAYLHPVPAPGGDRLDFLFTPPGVEPLQVSLGATLGLDELAQRQGPGWERLQVHWAARTAPTEAAAPWALALCWRPALVTRVQLALLHAIERGILRPGADRWAIRAVEREMPACALALADLGELMRDLEQLYGAAIWPRELQLNATGDAQLNLDVSAFTSYLVETPAWGERPLLAIRAAHLPGLVDPTPGPVTASGPMPNPEPSVLRRLLRRLFRKEEFREGQLAAIQRSLAGRDSLVLLPTGAGKSLVYQLAGLLLPGVTMVVDPILSLIEDQVYNLRRYGIDRAVGISGLIEEPKERQALLEGFGRGDFLFCLVAPERLQTPSFRAQCRTLAATAGFSLWVVDEAHCVSEWGHEFRTAYLNLGRVARALGGPDAGPPPLLALTGTASPAVLRDVQRELGITEPDALLRPPSFDRPELHFAVKRAPSTEKQALLFTTLEQVSAQFGLTPAALLAPKGPQTLGGLVFCPHVNGRVGVVAIAEALRTRYETEVRCYAGGAPSGWVQRDWNREKSEQAARFKENQFALLVCTKAFGMGIDKPNIRYTLHFGIPGSLEAYYQEAGRAGRDRQDAYGYILFSDDQPERASQLLDPDLTLAEVKRIEQAGPDDDLSRAFAFHLNAFAGLEAELEQLQALIAQLEPITAASGRPLAYPSDPDRAVMEKAIHRLHLLGVVADYTLDYGGQRFLLDLHQPSRERVTASLLGYVTGYSIWRARGIAAELASGPDDPAGFLRHAAQVLLRFVYEAIEQGRRAALREMYLAAKQAESGEALRQRLLAYLQESPLSQVVAALPALGPFAADRFAQALAQAATPADAEAMRGAVIRLLEAQPDAPSLLILRGFLEAVLRQEQADELASYLRAGLRSLANRYAATDEEQREAKLALVRLARQYLPGYLATVTGLCVEQDPETARALLRQHGEEEVAGPALAALLAGVGAQLTALADRLT